MNEQNSKASLEILDKLDEFRRKHQDDKQHPSDWCMRVMEAIVAEAFGFEGRNSWTDALATDPNSRYYRDVLASQNRSFDAIEEEQNSIAEAKAEILKCIEEAKAAGRNHVNVWISRTHNMALVSDLLIEGYGVGTLTGATDANMRIEWPSE